MIIYVDETKESQKALELVIKRFGNVPVAPASGSQLPEFVYEGVSYIGLMEIETRCKKP